MEINQPFSIELPISVSDGGTGRSSFTPYAILAGGTTSIGALQQVSGLGSSGQVLTSSGAGALPIWATPTTGTVTSVASADGSINVTNPTSTVDLAVVKSPKLTTGRTISITGDLSYTSPSFDGTGNVTAAGTLATVNSNVGSFGASAAIPVFTVNAKGLITAASTSVVVAPAGTLTGNTLASNVVTSSLTTVGTISTGVWQGTKIANAYLTPAGSDTQVQFNDGGSTFGTDAAFTWDKVNNILTLSDGFTNSTKIQSSTITFATIGYIRGADGGVNQSGTDLFVYSGTGNGTGAGGNVSFIAGDGGATAGVGGYITFTPGKGVGGGADGLLSFVNPTSGYAAIFDMSVITTSAKVFTYPNRNGTFVVSGDTLTGDITATFNSSGATATTLATVNSNVGTFGSATQSPQLTVNGKGLVTAVSNVTITPAASSITGAGDLTKTDDTNVTLTLGGTPVGSLLKATSLTLGWSGTLAVSRGGTGGGSASITLFNNITGFSAAGATGTTSTNLVFSGSPTISDLVTISGAAPSLVFTDTTASAKSLTIAVDANAASIRESAGTATSLIKLDLSNNRFGLGMTPNFTFDMTSTTTATSGNVFGANILATHNPATDSSGSHAGLALVSNTVGASSVNFTGSIFGLFFNADHNGSGQVNILTGTQGKARNLGSGVVVLSRGLYTGVHMAGAGSITSGYGMYIDLPTVSGGGTLTRGIGAYILNQGNAGITSAAGLVISDTSAATNNTNLAIGIASSALPTGSFSIYNASANDNYFAGKLGVGTTAPHSLLDVSSTTGGIITITRVDTSITANDSLGILQWYAADTSTTTTFINASIEVQATNTVTTDINPSRMIFSTTPTGVAAVLTEAFRLENDQTALFAKTISKYNGISTAGLGVPVLYSAPAISATKSANFTVLTYTPPATAGQYRVEGVITTTSSTNTGTVQFTIDYVDSQGTTHTADIIALQDASGVIATTKTGASKEFHAVGYNFTINNSATAIVLKVVITGTVSYTVTASLEQLV